MNNQKTKFTVNIGQLKLGFEQVNRVIGRATEFVSLVGRPGSLEIQKSLSTTFCKFNMAAPGCEDFQMTIDGVRLRALLATADPTKDVVLVINRDTNKLEVSFGNAKIKIPDLGRETMLISEAAWNAKDELLSVKGADIKAALKQVVGLCADEKDVRYYLRGVFFTSEEIDGVKKLVLVGTDGHILTMRNTDVILPECWVDAVVPEAIIRALIPCLGDDEDVRLTSFSAKEQPLGVGFKTPSFEVVTPTIAGKFPDWRRVIPEISARQKATIKRIELLASATRMGLVGELYGKQSPVKLSFSDDGSDLVISDVRLVEDDESFDLVPLNLDQSDESFGATNWFGGFNHALLEEALSPATDEFVDIYCDPAFSTDPKKESLLIMGVGWKTVVMPMKI